METVSMIINSNNLHLSRAGSALQFGGVVNEYRF